MQATDRLVLASYVSFNRYIYTEPALREEDSLSRKDSP